jgi:hypothetical protein
VDKERRESSGMEVSRRDWKRGDESKNEEGGGGRKEGENEIMM